MVVIMDGGETETGGVWAASGNYNKNRRRYGIYRVYSHIRRT